MAQKVKTAQIDPSSESWTQISSGVTGWGSTTSSNIWWKQIGKTVFMTGDIAGTSNSSTTSITLPVAPSTHCKYYEGQIGLVIDNGSVGGPGRWSIDNQATSPSPATVVGFFTNQGGSNWTATGTKQLRFSMFYEAG